jgi:hypothetical protein
MQANMATVTTGWEMKTDNAGRTYYEVCCCCLLMLLHQWMRPEFAAVVVVWEMFAVVFHTHKHTKHTHTHTHTHTHKHTHAHTHTYWSHTHTHALKHTESQHTPNPMGTSKQGAATAVCGSTSALRHRGRILHLCREASGLRALSTGIRWWVFHVFQVLFFSQLYNDEESFCRRCPRPRFYTKKANDEWTCKP